MERCLKKTVVERNIAKGIKLRRQRLDIINKKKENINNELFNNYFDYLNPDTMFKRLRDAKNVMKKIKIWWNQSTRY